MVEAKPNVAIPCPLCGDELYDGVYKIEVKGKPYSECTFCRHCHGCIKNHEHDIKVSNGISN